MPNKAEVSVKGGGRGFTLVPSQYTHRTLDHQVYMEVYSNGNNVSIIVNDTDNDMTVITMTDDDMITLFTEWVNVRDKVRKDAK